MLRLLKGTNAYSISIASGRAAGSASRLESRNITSGVLPVVTRSSRSCGHSYGCLDVAGKMCRGTANNRRCAPFSICANVRCLWSVYASLAFNAPEPTLVLSLTAPPDNIAGESDVRVRSRIVLPADYSTSSTPDNHVSLYDPTQPIRKRNLPRTVLYVCHVLPLLSTLHRKRVRGT